MRRQNCFIKHTSSSTLPRLETWLALFKLSPCGKYSKNLLPSQAIVFTFGPVCPFAFPATDNSLTNILWNNIASCLGTDVIIATDSLNLLVQKNSIQGTRSHHAVQTIIHIHRPHRATVERQTVECQR